MKVTCEVEVERVNLTIRADIKAAMETLRARKHRIGGGYVSLGTVFGEAALLLLEQEGMPIDPPPDGAALTRGKPPKSMHGRRRMAAA
jgi:hypothetical protein